MIERILYAASGPADLIASHERWKRGEHNPTEVSITFSGQIQDFCRDLGAKAYFVSTHPQAQLVEDGAFKIEHRPKPQRRGALYHLGEVAYGIGLLVTAIRFGAQVALIDSGTTHYFVLSSFRLFGIRVVPILHNTLWPKGYPPHKAMQRIVLAADRFFWERVPAACIAVSPECERQVNELRKTRRYPVLQTRAQFLQSYFAQIPPAPSHSHRPFRIMFIGRIDRIKGVFDILEIARRIEDSNPGLIRWEICGRGKDFDEFVARHKELFLNNVVFILGWTSLTDLLTVYAKSHASIVPTRSDFIEGLAMTAAESILAGRPVITNPVVPALEVLRPASMAAKTDDVDSHLQCVMQLATDARLYEALCSECASLRAQFYDRNFGLSAVLRRALLQDEAAPVRQETPGGGVASQRNSAHE